MQNYKMHFNFQELIGQFVRIKGPTNVRNAFLPNSEQFPDWTGFANKAPEAMKNVRVYISILEFELKFPDPPFPNVSNPTT